MQFVCPKFNLKVLIHESASYLGHLFLCLDTTLVEITEISLATCLWREGGGGHHLD